MNDRIRELAEQAEWSVRWGNPNNYEEYNRSLDEWQEKFAELIIRECYEWAKENGGLGTEYDYNALKEHFGVTE